MVTVQRSITPLMKRALLWASLSTFLFLVKAENPIVQTIYTADPAPIIFNDTLYVFTGHDEDGSTTFNMLDWRLFSTKDMVNWRHHPVPMSLATFSWASTQAWAGQVAERNGRFYFYVPVRNRGTNRMAIGVGVSDTIEGPYRDAIGRPLLENDEIDPSVFIDDDGQAYLYWGNPNLWYVKLNQDMISYSGSLVKVQMSASSFGQRNGNAQRPYQYEEGPWLYKRSGLYYMLYAGNCCSENIQYSTGPSATGPWTYRGILMPTQGASFTNHPGVIDYKGQSYFFYHNGALPGGSGYTRSVSIEPFQYRSDGLIPSLSMTKTGAPQIGSLNPYVRQEAETIAWSEGVETEAKTGGGLAVAFINNNDYIKVAGVDFGSGASRFTASVAAGSQGGNIELRLGSATGTLVGTARVGGTGGWQTFVEVSTAVSGASGKHDLYFRFTGGSDYLLNFDWWQFSQ